ncbi:MAG: NUDIX hydrolase [Acidobacteriaceae bacterium]|jgi:ADP-ribose pyrophosphatase|nr:NUDIX hydrolase [Acidobacteriaceae bacterium]
MPIVFTSKSFAVEVTTTRSPSGRTHETAIVRHMPAVVILPITDAGRVVLIRQFRPSVNEELWEVPAGSLKDGEEPEEGARRECEEETGLVPGQLVRLCAHYPAPGFCDERLIFYKATALTPASPDSTRHPDDDEEIEVREVTVAEAKSMVARGEIKDLKTAYALSLV